MSAEEQTIVAVADALRTQQEQLDRMARQLAGMQAELNKQEQQLARASREANDGLKAAKAATKLAESHEARITGMGTALEEAKADILGHYAELADKVS
jgi:hypothetical protein